MKCKVLVLLAVFASGAALAGKYDAKVTILNNSSWDIHELYLSSTGDDEWGPDQLGSDVIGNDVSYELHSIPCDDYDVRLVDEDGDECVVEDVSLCADSDTWEITDEDLLACQVLTED